MKLGIIRDYSPEGFDFVKSKGLEFIEVCCNYDNDSERFISSAADIKKNIERTGIPVLSCGRWNAVTNVKGKADEKVTALIDGSIAAAAEIGSPVFNLGVNYDESISKFRNYCFAVDYIGARLEHAEKLGIRIALYNCDWSNFLYSPEAWSIMIGEYPELGIKFDCSHSTYRGSNYLKEINDWAEHILHMHVKGTAYLEGKGIDDPPAGIDFVEWRKVFALLYAHGYDGTLSIEPHSSVWKGELGEKGIDYTIKYIKPLILK